MWEAGGYLASLGSKSKLAAILFTIKNNHPLRMVMNSFNHIYIDFLVRCLKKYVTIQLIHYFLSSLPNLSKSCMALLTQSPLATFLKSLLNVWP